MPREIQVTSILNKHKRRDSWFLDDYSVNQYSSYSDSKTLMMNAIKKHYPDLEEKYMRLLKDGTEVPIYYQEAFNKKMKELGITYGLETSILGAAGKLFFLDR